MSDELNEINEYKAKAEYLGTYYEMTAPCDFYRDMFPVGTLEREGCPEDKKPNAIMSIIEPKRAYNRIIFDDLNEIELAATAPFVVCSPVSYYGRNRTASNSSFLHGFAIDIDGVGMHQLNVLLHWFNTDQAPNPTYIVNSGHGLHLYYLLKNPIPLYQSIQDRLRKFKYELTRQIWTHHTSTVKDVQYQGIFQGFRMPGSQSKLGAEYPVTAYRAGEKVDIEYLNRYVPENERLNGTEYTSKFTVKEAAAKYPEWYERRIVRGEKRRRWHIKPDLYEWWIKKVQREGKIGHRYFCIAALAAYARKCDISEEQLRQDVAELAELFNGQDTDNPFTMDDIEAAMNFYVDDFVTYPRSVIAKTCAIEILENQRRNGRTQAAHLRRARALQALDDPDGNWRNKNGRPKGSPNKEHQAADVVAAWRAAHPDGRKCECIADTGLTKPTVYKWWSQSEADVE